MTVNGPYECQAVFRTAPTGGQNNDVTVLFDAPATGARVVDVNTGMLNCTAGCTVPLPVAQSPIRLRPVNEGANWLSWVGCDSVVPDPANATGPSLCEIAISGGPRSVTVEFGL